MKLKLDAASDDDEEVDLILFKQLIGYLRYLCNSRPNIAFSIRLVSGYMSEPKSFDGSQDSFDVHQRHTRVWCVIS